MFKALLVLRVYVKMRILCSLAIALSFASSADADLRELSQSELRRAVNANQALPTRSLISGVENYTGGDVVDIRAFMLDGVLTYRILFQNQDGSLGSILIDGTTGSSVVPSSDTGQQVISYALANNGNDSNSNNAGGNLSNSANINSTGNGHSGGGNSGGGNSGGGNSGGGNSGGGNSGGGNSGGGNSGGGNSGGNGRDR